MHSSKNAMCLHCTLVVHSLNLDLWFAA